MIESRILRTRVGLIFWDDIPVSWGFGLQSRVAIALLESALDFGVQNTRGILIRINLTQQQLANLVGATRQRVGEVLQELQRQNLVVREGRQLAVVVGSLDTLIKKAAGNSYQT
jgi:hypothetical protein